MILVVGWEDEEILDGLCGRRGRRRPPSLRHIRMIG